MLVAWADVSGLTASSHDAVWNRVIPIPCPLGTVCLAGIP